MYQDLPFTEETFHFLLPSLGYTIIRDVIWYALPLVVRNMFQLPSETVNDYKSFVLFSGNWNK